MQKKKKENSNPVYIQIIMIQSENNTVFLIVSYHCSGVSCWNETYIIWKEQDASRVVSELSVYPGADFTVQN